MITIQTKIIILKFSRLQRSMIWFLQIAQLSTTISAIQLKKLGFR